MVSAGLMTVEFRNVGQNNLSWTAQMQRPANEAAIVRAIRKKGALMSRDIGIEFDPLSLSGSIYAGFRCVGRFEIVDPLEAAAVQTTEASHAAHT